MFTVAPLSCAQTGRRIADCAEAVNYCLEVTWGITAVVLSS